MNREDDQSINFSRKVFFATITVLAVVITILLAWYLVQVLLLVFLGMLFAILLRAIANVISRYSRIPVSISLSITLFMVLGAAGLFSYVFAPTFADQINSLTDQMPHSVEELKKQLLALPVPDTIVSALSQLEWSRIGQAAFKKGLSMLSLSFDLIGALFIVVFSTIYFAFNPETYIRGLMAVVPREKQDSARVIIERVGSVLRWWLIGQFVAMAFVGILTAVGLSIIGVAPALALGVLAGLLDFLPYIGPVLAFSLIVLVAFEQGSSTVISALILYLIIQNLESHIIVPLVQREAVSLPPVLTLTAQIMMGTLVGLLGFLVATPFVAVILVLIDAIYVQGLLRKTSVLS